MDARRHRRPINDDGSITPLVLGMSLCLLLLVFAVTAVGSGFLAHSRLQNQCDGAVLAAGEAADIPGSARSTARANDAAIEYLRIRPGIVGVTVRIDDDRAYATCWADADITFGAIFLNPTVHQEVTSTALLVRREG